ncbi:MAG: NADH-quinone oxidoreductase subunit F [Deltaproteobacteria bacterium]|nr:MAG: NADH-quinone oxidoreductase subunit F [Deltaproteobacteria bacterium]
MKLDLQRARKRFEALVEQARQRWQQLDGEQAISVWVGSATCGLAAGAREVEQALREAMEQHQVPGQVMRTGCLGHCYAEPMVLVRRPGFPSLVYHHLNPALAQALVKNFLASGEDPLLEYLLGAAEPNDMFPRLEDLPRFGQETRWLLGRAGRHDPDDIFQALALGAYRGLLRALEAGPQAIIDTIEQAGLRGLGGAGFPTARKWRLCRDNPRQPHLLVCNADEGDPGAYMDRTLLESDPHAVLEGMIIAALATGAEHGYVYVRAEYPLAVERLQRAVQQARQQELLGDVLGSGFSFDVEIVRGAGAFVCGEETAMMESLEGRRGMPRVRPPYPVEWGLHGLPTVIDNVKTLANTGRIMDRGAEEFRKLGIGEGNGTALFALAGKVANAGLVEVPMGSTLRQVIFDICGGIQEGRQFKAVQIGGPSGGCLPESLLDTPVDFDKLRQAGAMMGSGGMVVLDEQNCMVETARFFLEFTQAESCGKCTFCRIGTRHMLDILERIVRGEGVLEDLDRLERLAVDIQQGSLCNLGRTAPNPVLSALRYFREEFIEHIEQKKCRAGVCNELTAYYILPEKCARGCDACVGSCPVEAIFTSPKRRIKVIDQSLCTKCDSCRQACPEEYDAVVKISPLSELPKSEPPPERKTADQEPSS